MNFKGFSLEVPECREETTKGHIVMEHGENYTLKLSNRHKENKIGKPCDVDLWIDGINIGSFRIPYGETIIIERPTFTSEKFAAFRKDSREAYDADIDSNSEDLGLIKAVFRSGHYIQNINVPISIKSWTYPKSEPEPWKLPSIQVYAVTDWDTVAYQYANSNDTTTTSAFPKPNSSSSAFDYVGGGTGLSGESDQRFNEVESLMYDEPSVTIYLRLVFDPENKNVIKPLKRKVYSTEIPKRL